MISLVLFVPGRMVPLGDVEHVEGVKWYAPRVRHVVADVRAVAVAGAAPAAEAPE